jgi:porin
MRISMLTVPWALAAIVGAQSSASSYDDLWQPADLSLSLGAFQDDTPADAAAPAADAPPAVPDLWSRPKILGDAWGVRPTLAEHGVSVDITMSHFFQSVASGGRETTSRYGGAIDTVLNADTGKLGLWQGGLINMHARTRWGSDVLTAAGGLTLPNARLLYPLPDDYNGTEITGITYTHTFIDGEVPVAQAFFGKLDAFDLVTGLFPNTIDGGLKGFMNPYSTVSTLPFLRYITLSQWGGGAWLVKDGQASTGFIVFGEENTSTTWDWSESWSDGVGMGVFHRITWELADKPGYMMLWVSGSTRDYRIQDPIDWGVLPGRGPVPIPSGEDNPWGFAAYLHQVVWQEEGNDSRFVQVMVGGSAADDKVSFSDVNVFANIESFGPFPSRPNDRVGFGYWYNGLTEGFKAEFQQLGINLRDMWGFEAYYNFEVTPWFHVTPNVQVIRNEFDRDNTALLVGVRGVLDF